MFGTYRWFLSIMVVYSHLGPFETHAVGYYAVFGFFTLSGYLMTKILSETYLPQPNGMRRYLLNRFLRIYPLYWLVLIFSIAVHVAFSLDLPQTVAEWVHNTIIFGLVYPHGVRIEHILVGPAWSLSTEFIFYLLIPFLIRNRFMFGYWVGFSILFAGAFYIDNQNLLIRYFSLIAASMPFAVGCALYMWREHLPALGLKAGLVCLGVTLILYLFPTAFFISPADEQRFFHQAEPSLYIMFAANVLVIHFLSRIDATRQSPRFRRFDSALGNLSYPLFLLHRPISDLFLQLFPGSLTKETVTLFIVCLPFIHLAAWALHAGCEKKIEAWRDRIRTAGA